MSSFPRISVVIPVYNAEETLMELVARLGNMLPRLANRFEVVLVDDGSRDKSWDVIRTLSQKYGWVRGIKLMRNYGQHNALLCGIRAAECDTIITMDDDLQHPPEEIPKLLDKLGEGYDVVYGPPEKEQHGFWRNLASQTTKFVLQTIMGAETARNVSAFRAFRAQVCESFASYRSPFVSIDVLLSWGTASFGYVKVKHEVRYGDRSNYTFRKLLVHAFNMMTGFSILPLQLASLIGFTFTFLGFVILIYIVGRYMIFGSSVPGFSFLASLISVFSGTQLFSLGILGEYLARVHFRMMDRPPYVTRSRTSEGSRQDALSVEG